MQKRNYCGLNQLVVIARASLAAALMLMAVPGLGEQVESLQVVVKERQSIRDIAKEHLADPDLWIKILRFNNLSSITQVVPGTELRIPVGLVSRANKALRESLEIIQEATQEGAKHLVPDLIGKAIDLRYAALERRKADDWENCTQLARDSKAVAEEALTTTLVQRNAAAEAFLSDRQGSVQGRKPTDLVWEPLFLNAILVEQQRVRTLSQSTAQITFRDESRLRLNENSQAVIQRMRTDPLRRTEKAEVTLVEGDLYAFLEGKSKRKKFELVMPGVDTQIESTNFWASREGKTTKFANYDDRKLYVSSASMTVALGKNQGTLVRHRQRPKAAVDLLPEPQLLSPIDDSVTFSNNPKLTWLSVSGAMGYWLEIAADEAFKQVILSQWGDAETSFRPSDLENGLYYWRIAALDRFGLPGRWSEILRFHVQRDANAPFLLVRTSEQQAIVRRANITISGKTESKIELNLNGRSLDVDSDGTFQGQYQLLKGTNELVFEADDHVGNVTRRVRSVIFIPDEAAPITYDPTIPQIHPNHFVTQENVFSLAGLTTQNAQIRARSTSGAAEATAHSDAAGVFRLNLPIEGKQTVFDLEVTALSGFVTRDHLTVTVDKEPPAIELDDWPPPYTAFEELLVRGRVLDGTNLILNGKPVPLIDERFEETLTLETGSNQIELVAVDLVGNVHIERLQVCLDQEPPQLLSHRLSEHRASGGERVVIEVQADDASGMKKVAAFTAKVGQSVFSDYLRLNKATRCYRGVLVLPQHARGKITLKNIELEDSVGNRRRYAFKKSVVQRQTRGHW